MPEIDDIKGKVKTTYQISQMFTQEAGDGEYLLHYDKQMWVPFLDAEAEIQKLTAKLVDACNDADKRYSIHKQEIEKWKQQQKDDYATYIEACADRDHKIMELKAEIELIKSHVDSVERDNVQLGKRVISAKKLSENIYHKCLDEWCKTDDCPDCEDCSFLGEIKRLYEVLK